MSREVATRSTPDNLNICTTCGAMVPEPERAKRPAPLLQQTTKGQTMLTLEQWQQMWTPEHFEADEIDTNGGRRPLVRLGSGLDDGSSDE